MRGQYNSSITRVRPVFNHLIRRDPSGGAWLGALLWTAGTPDLAESVANDPGPLLLSCLAPRPFADPILRAYGQSSNELAGCFERAFPPPDRFLRWLIDNLGRMTWPKDSDGRDRKFSPDAQRWRRVLLGHDGPLAQAEAQAAARTALETRGPVASRRAWWAFEGYTAADCCLETERLLLIIEGKRTEAVAAATDWYPERDQIVRNLEVADTASGGKAFLVMLIAEQCQYELSGQ